MWNITVRNLLQTRTTKIVLQQKQVYYFNTSEKYSARVQTDFLQQNQGNTPYCVNS